MSASVAFMLLCCSPPPRWVCITHSLPSGSSCVWWC